MRRTVPPMIALTVWMFGRNRRELTLWAWLIWRPKPGLFPQISQDLDMTGSEGPGRPRETAWAGKGAESPMPSPNCKCPGQTGRFLQTRRDPLTSRGRRC